MAELDCVRAWLPRDPPLASEASSSLPRWWRWTRAVIRGGVEDPVTSRVGPDVTIHDVLGYRNNTTVSHVAPFKFPFSWVICHSTWHLSGSVGLGFIHAGLHNKLLWPRNISQEPGVYLTEVHRELLGSDDVVGGAGRKFLDGGRHHGDKLLPVVLADRGSILAHSFSMI